MRDLSSGDVNGNGVSHKNPWNFAILAQGQVDEIRKLQADVDGYITRLEQVAEA